MGGRPPRTYEHRHGHIEELDMILVKTLENIGGFKDRSCNDSPRYGKDCTTG
jgi:hypothetical protein